MKTLARLLLYGSALAALPAQASPTQDDQALVRAYFASEWKAYPVGATSLGVHDGAALLDDVSASAVQAEIARLEATKTALAALDARSLAPMDRDDRDVLAAQIDGQLLEYETVQQWRHNPATYVDLMTNAIYQLIERDFAPLPQRLRSVIAREQAIPAMLEQAKHNLADMPPVFIDVALENLGGADSFFGHDVPLAFAAITDQAQKAKLAASTKATLDAVAAYKAWLVAAKPDAHGSFVLGRESFQRLLASDMVNVPVERVLEAGRAQLQRDHDAFLATEKLVDPKDPSGALAVIEADHPDGPGLVTTARQQLYDLRTFIDEHHIVTLPSRLMPTVGETPPFARAMIFGEEDAPGPLETHATQAYYFITPADSTQSAAEQDKYLSYFNRPLLLNLSVHEALPGHFTQFLFAEAHPEWSLVRKAAHSYTATEGWAHYTEQMMQDEGLGQHDPKLRLAQLQDALLRDCRLVVSIGMHTGGMSLADATKLMGEECFQPASVAYKEARRGTADPGYFSYTLGKLEILKLRDDVRAQEGAKFSLARFHDRFLGAGLVPIAVIRREIMGRDGPVL